MPLIQWIQQNLRRAKGYLTQTLNEASSEGSGKLDVRGNLAVTLDAVGEADLGNVDVVGSLAQTLEAATIEAVGRTPVRGYADSVLAPCVSIYTPLHRSFFYARNQATAALADYDGLVALVVVDSAALSRLQHGAQIDEAPRDAALASPLNEATLLLSRQGVVMLGSYKIKVGDLLPPIEATLTSTTPNFMATAQGVRFRYRLKDAAPASAVVREASIVSRTDGRVRYDWQAGDTDVAGTYVAEWVVDYPNGPATFPNQGSVTFEVLPHL